MKKLFLSFFLLITALINLNAQKTIINPTFSFQISLSKITKIELTDTATILYFKTIVKPGSSIFIDSNNYISPVNSNKKLFVKGYKGIPVGWNKTWNILDSGVVHFELIYPPVDSTVTNIDFKGNDSTVNNYWEILNISFLPKKTIFPEQLMGNWLENNSHYKWIFGLYDSVAIYDNTIWHYKNIIHKNDSWEVVLLNNEKQVTINFSLDKNGNCIFNSSKNETPIICTKRMGVTNNYQSYSKDNTFGIPFFRKGYATIKGYVDGYFKMLSNNPLLTIWGNPKNPFSGGMNVIRLKDDGTFEIKIPLSCPTYLSLSIPGMNDYSFNMRNVYAEPGDETICYFNLLGDVFSETNAKEIIPTSLYMGDNASVSTEMFLLTQTKLPDVNNCVCYDKIDSANISNISLKGYKDSLILEKKQQDDFVNSMLSGNSIGNKTAKIALQNNKLSFCKSLLGYNQYNEWRYRTKNKIAPTEKVTIKPVNLGFPYLDPIKETINDSLCLVSNSFVTLLCTMENLDEVKNVNFGIYNIMTQMMIEKVVFNKEEMKLYDELKNLQDPNYLIDDMDWYHKEINHFKNKYEFSIQNVLSELMQMPLSQKAKTYFSLAGLPGDIINFRDACSTLYQTKNTLKEYELDKIHRTIKNEILNNYLDEIKTEMAKPKVKEEGVLFKNTPFFEGGNVFEAIMDRYKGKPVLAFLWGATNPYSTIMIKALVPLAKELKDSSIAFVYLSNFMDDDKIWKREAADVIGDHYRLNKKECIELVQKQNFKRFPRYIIIDKTGKIVFDEQKVTSNEVLKEKLLKLK